MRSAAMEGEGADVHLMRPLEEALLDASDLDRWKPRSRITLPEGRDL